MFRLSPKFPSFLFLSKLTRGHQARNEIVDREVAVVGGRINRGQRQRGAQGQRVRGRQVARRHGLALLILGLQPLGQVHLPDRLAHRLALGRVLRKQAEEDEGACRGAGEERGGDEVWG